MRKTVRMIQIVVVALGLLTCVSAVSFQLLAVSAAAVLHGCHTAIFPKTLCQIALGREACKVGDIGNVVVCIFQKILADFNPAAVQIVNRRNPVISCKFMA